ncbi:MAG TPA: BTAD domain-containing putative transcriptional regulator [Streptosporangiaceae bacterium]|jgi:DNA-binding SARP family transcriptional activator/tetratricopeptide (TPR) repeat protein
MRVRILGPFHLDDGARQITIGGARQRAVLADLVLHANEVVPSEQILVDLWGEDSPPSAANALQAAISRLRRMLPPGRLITTGPGYMLRVFPAELDVAQFGQLIFEGRDALAAGAAAEAVQLLDQAMVLWRGPPLADFRYEPFAQTEIARLEELQLACLEERNEAHLVLGSAGALTADLGRMVTEHPLRERLRGQFMLALYRSGRQTEALETYREFRTVLREELGLEPSSALRKLEAAILRHDPVLAPGPPTSGAPLARRPVTVLCVALQLAPRSGTELDPEAHGVVHERVVSALAAVLERHGGKLAASDSEHLMGVFGVTTLHEDDALRAVRASLEAREALSAEATALPRHYPASLVYRFGLATGEALVGGSGPLGFAGDVGARAVMLAEAAEPGQILIAPQVRQLTAGAIEIEEAGPDRFLLRSAHAGLRPLPVRLDVPLVGRGEEMRRLEAAYTRATRERLTVTVRVIGEAGLGKTRLIQEFAGNHRREAHVLSGRCLPYGEGITFWPLRDVVRQAAGGDSTENIKALLAGEADAPAVTDQLHRALGAGTQGRTAAAEIFWAARRFLETLARRRPVLVVFEDLHWAEPTFLDLVESLALQPGAVPMLLVCIGRPELLDQRPAWAEEADRAVCIQLAPLGEGAATVLLDSVSAGHHIAPSTRARLIDTAGGNPLYLEQLTVSLSEQSGSDIRLELPPTIAALLSARLQRLGPGASSVLVRAAIVGKDFGEQQVRALLPVEARAPLSRNLQTLVAKGLVQRGPSGTRPAAEYSFRHILIQEAAYRATPKSLRAELHHRFADWLEAVTSDPFPGRTEILGYHLEQSVRYRNELWPADPQSATLSHRAAAYLDTAGCAAYDRGDDVAAVNLLDRAAALLPGDNPALGPLYTSLGTALIEAGQLEKAKATLAHAQRITAANGDDRLHARARVEALLLDLKMTPTEAAVEIGRELPELRREFEQNHDDLGICRTLLLEAAVHWDHSRSGAAQEAWQRAAECARTLKDRRQLADILAWLASAALWGPTPAPEGMQRCQEYLQEVGNHPVGQAQILLHLAGLYAMQDDFATAHTALNSAKDLLDTLGPTMTAAIIQPAALIAMLAGDPAAAERYLRPEYNFLYQMGERRLLSTTAVKLARALAAQGPDRYDEAIRLIATSREAAADGDLSPQALGQGLYARILADRGRYREAEELARSAVALAAQTDLLSHHADILLELSHVLTTADQVSEAHSVASQAFRLYQRKGNLPGARESRRYLTQSIST